GSTNECSAGSKPGDEVGETAPGLLDDLHAGGFVVGPPVRRVAVLIRVEVAVRFALVSTTGFADRAVAAFHRIGEDEIGTEDIEQLLALSRDVGGHTQHHAIPAGGTDHRV